MSDAQASPSPVPKPPHHMVWRPAWVRLLVLAAAALLGLGLVAPALTIETEFGRFDTWVRLFKPDMATEETVRYSLITGILALFEERETLIATVLVAFSVFFPTLKLTVMAAANERLARGRRPGFLLGFAHHAGKFSMLDVLVVALLILAIKGIPGDSEATVEWGLYVFAASVLLSLLASAVLSHMSSRLTRFEQSQSPPD
jgi:paraquat-inducible protein A